MASLLPWKRNTPAPELTPHDASSLSRLRWDMDRMFDRLLADFWSGSTPFGLSAGGMSVDLSENDERIRVRAELPGLDPADIELSLSGDVLTISGEKRDEHRSEDGDRTFSERRFGSFRRSIQLPAAVDADTVEAEHRHGVLTVTLTKSETARPRRIEVKTK